MAKHFELTSPNAIHPAAFVSATDPASDPNNNVAAFKFWVDTSSGPPFALKMRNSINSAWQAVGSTGGGSGSTIFLGSGEDGEEGPMGPPGTGTTINDAVRVVRTTNQSITDNTHTAISWEAVDTDSNSMWAGGNPTRMTVKHTGFHTVSASITFASNSTGIRYVGIKKNGTTWVAFMNMTPVSGADTFAAISHSLKLTLADYIEITVLQNSGGNLNALVNSDWSPRGSLVYLCAG
jgi:hypothetical protein